MQKSGLESKDNWKYLKVWNCILDKTEEPYIEPAYAIKYKNWRKYFLMIQLIKE